MPYDPRTGQVMPYSTSYSSMGMEEPLSAEVSKNFPGIISSMALGQRRGANTIMRGGFMDRGAASLHGGLGGLRNGVRLRSNDALRRFVGDELTDISAGGRFTRGSYAGPLGLRRQKAARMAARMQPVGANGPVNIHPAGAVRGSATRYNRIMTSLHRRNWSRS